MCKITQYVWNNTLWTKLHRGSFHIQYGKIPLTWKFLHWRRRWRQRLISGMALDKLCRTFSGWAWVLKCMEQDFRLNLGTKSDLSHDWHHFYHIITSEEGNPVLSKILEMFQTALDPSFWRNLFFTDFWGHIGIRVFLHLFVGKYSLNIKENWTK